MSRLHRYLADVAHVDIYWFIGSRLDQISTGQLPKVDGVLTGSSVVPYRYHFNTGNLYFVNTCNLTTDHRNSNNILHLRILVLGGLGAPTRLDGAS